MIWTNFLTGYYISKCMGLVKSLIKYWIELARTVKSRIIIHVPEIETWGSMEMWSWIKIRN